ncbi:helicase-associated domain-containing protein [Kitasatospora purpeofusca]|uniref:helicase-associated domain-containing protein n=1 Tax=Kitasatospora purpeofusca TaxID=67352 RepID=UPI00367E50A2
MDDRHKTVLLAARPAAVQPPRPRTLHQLAARLLGTAPLSRSALDLGQQQFLEAAVAAADHTRRPGAAFGCDRAYLAALLGVGSAVTEGRFTEVLQSLTVLSLAWPDGTRLILHPDAPVLFPLALGRPAHGRPAMPATAPLAPAAPVPETRPAAGLGPGAAAAALNGMDTVLAAFDEPWPALRTGGIGVREIRRLARLLDGTEADARLWLHLAANLDLIAEQGGRWSRTGRAPGWSRTPPADRLAHLALAYSLVRIMPGLPPIIGDDPRLLSQFLPHSSGLVPFPRYNAGALRRTVLRVLASLPAGRAVVDAPALAAAVHYRSPQLVQPHTPGPPSQRLSAPPTLARPQPAAADVAALVLREAELLALADNGALTALGRAFLRDPADITALRRAGDEVLPLLEQAAILADHTVLVPGTPSPALAELLAGLCDLEFRDTHTSRWRFTPAGVRRYFDANPGTDPAELLQTLAARSTTPLPQVLTVLITDTAARHGHITVTQATTVLDVRTPALAAELAHHRELTRLQLRQVGPTTLLSPMKEGPVLAALRSAGYAPDGQPHPSTARKPGKTEEPDPAGAPYELPQGLPPQQRPRPDPADPGLWPAGPAVDDPSAPADDLARFIHDRAPVLGADDRDVLTAALRVGAGAVVHVEYRTQSRTHQRAIIRGPRLDHHDRLTSTGPGRQEPIGLAELQLVLPLPDGRKVPERTDDT